MQINVTFDTSVNSAPAGFKTAVNYAVGILDAAFTNNVIVNIKIGWDEVGGRPLDAGDLVESETAIAPSYDFTTSVLTPPTAVRHGRADILRRGMRKITCRETRLAFPSPMG